MARLRVGDIVIEDGDIRIGGRSMASAGPAARSTAPAGPRQPSRQELLAAIPLRGRVLAVAGAVVALAGVGWAAFLGPLAPGIFGFATSGIPLLAIGIGALAVGLLKRQAERRALAVRQAADDRLLRDRFDRLRPLLEAASEENTVEHLMRAAGMTEAAVVETLASGQRRGWVHEDLDVETGDWFYSVTEAGRSAAPADRAHLTVTERKALLPKAGDQE